MKIKKCIITFVVTSLIAIGVVAFPSNSFAMTESTRDMNRTVSQTEIHSIEKELKFIFEEASSYDNGILRINKQKLQAAYGKEMGAYVAEGIRQIYTNDHLAENILAVAQEKSFWSCMKGELIGLIPGVDLYQLVSSGDLKAYIIGKQWGKLSSALGTKLAKLGIRSNVAGIVASIAVGTGKCLVWG